jgi:predicted MPP superfamily phosphohydrolase
MTRRQWIRRVASGLGAGAAATAGYAWRIEPHWVDFAERRLPIAGLPRDLEGQRLVQLSDLHVGPEVDDDFLVETFRRITALRPAIVAITGDFVSYREAAHLGQLQRVIAHVPHGRLATIGVLGNHDYGSDWSQLDVADGVQGTLAGAGVTVIRNGVAHVSGLQVVGLDDFWSPRFAPQQALAGRDPRAPSLVLCHNPDAVDPSPGPAAEPEADPWAGYAGWILSGHTHGGQCRPPFLPPPLLPVRNRRYTAGAFALSGGRHLYINRGLGYLIRVRFNVRPEVTLFTLTRA